MNDQEFDQFCARLAHTFMVVQWGGAHVWKVGDLSASKVFAIGGWSQHPHGAFSFKTSELDYAFLQQKPGFKPAPYLASRGMKWIQAYEHLDQSELSYYLSESYRLASLNLTKKQQRALGLNQNANMPTK